jgi:adenylate cyclase
MKSFIAECQRRRVFRIAAFYIVAAWVVLQVADLAFESWGIPSQALRDIWIGVTIGFPIALFLGWRFDIAGGRIVRTPDDDADPAQGLARSDHVILGLAAIAAVVITTGMVAGVLQTRSLPPETTAIRDIDSQSIAVLPFVDLSPAGDQAYFSYGIAEELLNLLAKFGDLKVTSRTSSFKLSDAGLSVPEIAAQLGVAYVLEGSLRKAGEKIRVTAQLIDARSDTHVWSETYDRDLDDVFAIQDQISAKVAQELKATLRGAVPSADLTDAATYELYLQGRRLLARRGMDDLTQAIEIFERVTALDPSFAPGYASLAEALFWGGGPESGFSRLESSANRALELDPDNSEALAVLGISRFLRGDTKEGRRLLERAIASNPNNPLAYRWLGQTYWSSDPARYAALAHQAYLRDPLDPSIHWHQSNALRLLGRTEEALAVAGNRRAYDPDDPLADSLAASCHMSAGDLDLALKSYYRAYRRHPDSGNYEEILDVLGRFQELDLAEAWLNELERRFGNTGRAQAIVDKLRGKTEQGLQRMADAVERGRSDKLEQAFVTLRFTHDLERTRPIYEKGFAKIGKDPTRFDPDMFWVLYIDYALILQRAGETDKASGLILAMKTFFDAQIARGVLINVYLDHLQYLYATLLAINGETDEAVVQISQAVQDGFSCIGCMKFPHFDSIHDEPGFVAAREALEARLAAQRQRLADEGMLLTPEQVMALEDFDFDPFAD